MVIPFWSTIFARPARSHDLIGLAEPLSCHISCLRMTLVRNNSTLMIYGSDISIAFQHVNVIVLECSLSKVKMAIAQLN
jgi:hypothetical protein